MSKTVAFPSARPPTADDGLAEPQKQKPDNTERPQSAAPEKLARLTIDLPQELHGQFKAACAKQHTKMKDQVLDLHREMDTETQLIVTRS